MMQGKADYTEVCRPNHKTRGAQSPLGGGQPSPYTLHRDEDIASAPLERTRDAPRMTQRGGITPVSGREPKAM